MADIANIGERCGGSSTAGMFLQEFVPDGRAAGRTWTSPARRSTTATPYGYTPKGGTGVAVRTLVASPRTSPPGRSRRPEPRPSSSLGGYPVPPNG